jgi:argininosuccinate lyase
LRVFAGMVRTLRVKSENTFKAAGRGYILATDLADYLVGKGEAFRTAHEIVAKLVSYAAGKGKTFAELDIKEFKKFSPLFGADVRKITLESSIAARNVSGGTAPEQVKRALAKARRLIAKN